jgi:hypothetical protein
MANQKLNIDIVAKDRSKQALNNVQKGIAKVKGAVFNLRNAFLGLGAGLVARNLVNTGKELENLQVRLKFLLKDTNEGAKAFDNMVKFASKVPFSLEEIQAGSGILATVTDNADDLQNMLEITGNVAAVTGLDFRTASEQIQRSFSAGIGAADLFREKGVRNMLGFKAGATVSIEQTVQAFEKVFGKEGRFGKATDELANTFQGTLSMIGDKVFNFKKVLLEAGLFESLKKEFGALDKFLGQNAKSIDALATDIGISLGFAVTKIAKVIVLLKDNMDKFAIIVKGLIAIKVVKLFTALGGAILFAARSMAKFSLASMMTSKSIKSLVVLVAKGGALYGAFKGIDKLFQDTAESFEDFSNKVKNTLPDARDIHKTMIRTKESVVDIAKAEQAIAEAKEKQLKLQNFLLDEANEKRRKFHELEVEGLKKFKEMNKSFEEMNENSLAKLQEKLTNIGTTIKENLNAGISSFSNALARSIILGEDLGKSFKNMVANALVQTLGLLIEVIIRMGIQKLLGIDLEKQEKDKLNQARKYTSELKKQVGLAMLLAFFTGGSSMIPTGRASGGSVQKNQPYMVGENGPEMFIPNSSGQITQSARGTGGGETNVNFTINATDVRGVKELLIDNRATIVNVINSALNEKGKEALV